MPQPDGLVWQVRKEVQEMDMTGAENAGGPDWGGYWALADMMKADAEERERQQELLQASEQDEDKKP